MVHFQIWICTYEKVPFIEVSAVVLLSTCHGCKGETIKLIPNYMKDIIDKTVKPLHLEKLQITQNINKLSKSSSHFLIEFW